MKTAAMSAEKFVRNAGNASGDYASGVASTEKDQAARAIAAKESYQKGVTAAIQRGAYEKGLQKSGKQGWQDGVQKKGQFRFADGVSAAKEKYAQNSARYDGARGAAANMPRGVRGSAENYQRSAAVGRALNALRTGTSNA